MHILFHTRAHTQTLASAPQLCAAAAAPGATTETKEGTTRFLREAAAAFKLTCDVNAEHIVGVPHDSLVGLIPNVACLALKDQMAVVAGVSYVIADLPSAAEVTGSLGKVATPLMESLTALTAAAAAATSASRVQMTSALKLLSTVVQHCKLDQKCFPRDGSIVHPVAELVKAVWPTLEHIAKSFADEVRTFLSIFLSFSLFSSPYFMISI